MVQAIKDSLPFLAAMRGWRAATVAIAADGEQARAMSFLERVGPFDEVTFGRGWLSSAVLGGGVFGAPQRLAVPRLLVLTQVVDVEASEMRQRERELRLDVVGLDSLRDAMPVGRLAQRLRLDRDAMLPR
ncbi:MAG: hypothetical protein HYX65_10260 [Gemmatimonadetes bacterium]|nr:hypothetical protein [Gemmatimonadota bacterium]